MKKKMELDNRLVVDSDQRPGWVEGKGDMCVYKSAI